MKEAELHDLWSINESFARARDFPAVLDALATAVPRLIPRADMVILYLYDEERKVLRLGTGFGVVISSLKRIAFKPGESMTGQVFVSKQPVLCLGEKDVKERMANISSDNLRWYRQGIADKSINSSFSVPLLNGSRCIGTLAVNQHKDDGIPFSKKEVRLVAQLAVQGAHAIDHVRLFEQMAAETRELNESLFIQDRFARVLAESGGLEKVMTVLRRLLPKEKKVEFSEVKSHNNYTHPVLQGNEPIGWLVFNKKATIKERYVIEKAAETIAIMYRYEMNICERNLRMKESLFERVLNGSTIEEVAQLFSAHRNEYVRCLVFKRSRSELGALCQKIEQIALKTTSEVTVMVYRSHWVVVMNASEEQQIVSFSKSLYELPSFSSSVTIGVSRFVQLHDVADAYHEAVGAWEEGAVAGDSIAYYVKLGYKRLLNRIDAKDKQAFIQDHLGPLFSMEPVYIETLKALIASNRNRQQTANSLYIHANTLYQRVKRIEQELGVSFTEEAAWMNIVIAINLNDN
ncbi:helix-turn-helix domain-containing protein [Shouchella patagoniensis]|uniref:helix-turn-helix domain-containing protein n=1 Tax=Shouchella patagoniensis TaxID=228576 RepID=UPI001476278D|nr:helix-turn-helix domain-containing protein [Shouchella patagoniensis]